MKFSSFSSIAIVLALGADKSDASALRRLGDPSPFERRRLLPIINCDTQADCIYVTIEAKCSDNPECTPDDTTDTHECHYEICLHLDTDKTGCIKGAGGVSHICTKPGGCDQPSFIDTKDWKIDPGLEGIYCQTVSKGQDADFVIKDGNDNDATCGEAGNYEIPVFGGGGTTVSASCDALLTNAVVEGSCGGNAQNPALWRKQCLWQITAPNDCDACDEPTTTTTTPGSFGDPHFLTWGNQYFDFMGECDIVLAESKAFGNGLGMSAHVRTKARYEYSYIEAAAVRIGDDVLEVSSFGTYLLNGVSNVDLPTKIGNEQYSLTRTAKNDHDVTFDIEISATSHIQVKAFKDLVSVRFLGAEEENFHDVVGIMGSFGEGSRYSRDGLRVIEDNDEFGQEWMVRPGEDPELFQFKSLHTQCVLPSAFKDERRRLGESISVEAATKACEKLGDSGAVDACIYDVIATGDLSVAQAGAY